MLKDGKLNAYWVMVNNNMQAIAHPNDAPTQAFELGGAVDVLGALQRIGPVLGAVELDGYLPLLPAHVDAGDDQAPFIAHDDLGIGSGHTAFDEHEPRRCFLWRLGAGIHHGKRLP